MAAGPVVRVAVIDSGVHATHPHVGGVAGGIGVDDEGSLHEDFVDRLGHGTAVIAAIKEKAPDAEIYAIKVFDRELSATGRALVAACEYALTLNVKIVNLSLGTQNLDHEAALTDVIERICKTGAVVIAAGPHDGVRWLPGILPGVWAVSLDWSVPRDRFRLERLRPAGGMFRATGVPRPIPGVPPEKNLRGPSFAVANVSGIVARLLADEPTGDPAAAVTRAFEDGLLS
ncbi:MAG TPA: S8 family serine peptidase [Vicinamibacterales bacterium]|nr:S8 family serine peptidase [Vicinamibacterales bacterium]